MLLAPMESWLPLTVRVVVGVPPEPESDPLPRVVPPALKVTVPAGESVPPLAFTVAVRVVDAVAGMLVGFAVAVVAVAVTVLPLQLVISL